MSSVASSSSQPSPKPMTILIKARSTLKIISLENELRFMYKVRPEAPIDIAWAFAAIHEGGYSYHLKDNKKSDGAILFQTRCPIEDLREMWYEKHKDLHVMIETLNYAKDYTGERYFTKYWEQKDDLGKYISDDES